MSIEELVQSLIEIKREDDWWDFKEFHYEDKSTISVKKKNMSSMLGMNSTRGSVKQ